MDELLLLIVEGVAVVYVELALSGSLSDKQSELQMAQKHKQQCGGAVLPGVLGLPGG